jgi:hypothetical protein
VLEHGSTANRAGVEFDSRHSPHTNCPALAAEPRFILETAADAEPIAYGNRNVNRNVNRAGYGYRGGGAYRYGGWTRPGYGWRPGGAIAAGAAIGFVSAATAAAWAGPAPGPGLCWYYTDPSRQHGFWDACQ